MLLHRSHGHECGPVWNRVIRTDLMFLFDHSNICASSGLVSIN